MATKKISHEDHLFRMRIVDLCFSVVMRMLGCATTLGAIWLTFRGLQPILAGQSSEWLVAFAKITDSLRLGSAIGYIWGGAATAAWGLERFGKKRAIEQKSKLQMMIEGNDPNRLSSGLGPTGQTPRSQP